MEKEPKAEQILQFVGIRVILNKLARRNEKVCVKKRKKDKKETK
jgi:hypothetical protein